jgi:hypothetical protein
MVKAKCRMAKPDRSDFLLPTESGRGKVIATGITCKRVITNSRRNCELGTESTVWDDAAQTNVTVDQKGDANCVIGKPGARLTCDDGLMPCLCSFARSVYRFGPLSLFAESISDIPVRA